MGFMTSLATYCIVVLQTSQIGSPQDPYDMTRITLPDTPTRCTGYKFTILNGPFSKYIHNKICIFM